LTVSCLQTYHPRRTRYLHCCPWYCGCPCYLWVTGTRTLLGDAKREVHGPQKLVMNVITSGNWYNRVWQETGVRIRPKFLKSPLCRRPGLRPGYL
jgi:hypothetical protein